MSVLRSCVGWGVAGFAASTVLACSFLTSLSGLTGGAGDGGSEASVEDAATAEDVVPVETAEGGQEAGQVTPHDAGAPTDASDASAIPCNDGGIVCNGACIDPTSDPANCNGCGNTCGTGLCGTSLSPVMTTTSPPPPMWVFNGSAAYNSFAPSAELTVASVPGQSGTFVYEDPIAIDSFTAAFDFRIGLQGGSRSDGMGFVIEQSGPTAVGAAGAGLGMAGLAGFGVELDIYDNAYCADTSGDHVGVDDLTICPAQAGMPTSLFEADITSVLDLGDAHWHSAVITVASGALSLSIDGNSVISSVALTGLSPGAPYYLGFSGGTGGLLADDGGPGGYRQEVKDIVITFPTPRCL